MRRRLLLALPLLVGVLLGAAPASATTGDDPEVLRFEGTYTGVPYGGDDQPVDESTYGPFDAEVEFACVDGTCTLLSYNDEPPTPQKAAWTFTDGSGSWQTPMSGDVCAQTEVRAQSGTATLVGDELTVVVEVLAIPMTDCGGGSGRAIGRNQDTWTLELVQGELCTLDASCVEETPATAPPTSTGPRDFAQPTVFGGLETVSTAVSPANLIWAAVGTVVLALLVAIPTHFFNTAAETLSDRIGAWWRRWRKTPEGVERPGVALSGWPLAAAGVAVAAVIAAFADPDFGFDAAGLRVLLSILVAFGLEVVLGWFAVILIVRRTHPAAAATFRFAPLTLVLVAAAVALTRLTGFEPPIVFGLVAGVAFGGLLGTAEKARVALIGLGWAFGIGMLAWIAYSLLPIDLVVVRELLSTAAIAGISTLPIALLPLRGLAGRTVWEANRVVWLVAYAIGLFAFLLVLLPLPASWAEVGVGLWTWIGLYAAYALAAVGVWLVVTRPWRREPEAAA